MSKVCFSPTAGAVLVLLLSACATAPSDESVQNAPSPDGAPRLTAKPLSSPPPAKSGTDLALAPKAPIIYPGTGNFINQKAALKPAPATRSATRPQPQRWIAPMPMPTAWSVPVAITKPRL